ncbi:YfiR family protein [Pseudomonas alvandae]|uniref:YfiR family protein n=1 Tax=Pseudomonas canavaninivorans TaxID=2842348 RepID=UPI00215F1BDD|nr:YfiR family protein [Pseudomonas canavaninivorans]UVM70418.1 YfiR family protein [Pseudomonas canavaninivorans]
MRAIGLLLLVLAAWYVPIQPLLADTAVDERAMKVAYIYNFTLFAHWPSLSDVDFQLCILGNTPLDEELSRLKGKPAQNGLPIAIRWIMPNASFAGCQVLYIDEHNRRTLDALLQQLATAPVLTITDATGFSDRGIMIEMRRQGSRIVFDVNVAAARRVNLDFSSSFLKLASFVADRS